MAQLYTTVGAKQSQIDGAAPGMNRTRYLEFAALKSTWIQVKL